MVYSSNIYTVTAIKDLLSDSVLHLYTSRDYLLLEASMNRPNYLFLWSFSCSFSNASEINERLHSGRLQKNIASPSSITESQSQR